MAEVTTISTNPGLISQMLCQSPATAAHLDPGLRRALARRIAAQAPSRDLGPIRLDSYVITTVLRGGTLHREGPFHWSPRASRRLIGSAAVRSVLEGRASDALTGVKLEIAALLRQAEDRPDLRSGSLGQWLQEAPKSLRIAVAAEATTYATELLNCVDLRGLGASIISSAGDPQWAVPGAPWISLRGRRDLEVVLHEDHDHRAILALRSGPIGPDARFDLGIVALTAALSRPDAPLPGQIVGIWGAAGRAMVLPVDGETMKTAARQVLHTVEALGSTSHAKVAA